jgi:hypothetical protein
MRTTAKIITTIAMTAVVVLIALPYLVKLGPTIIIPYGDINSDKLTD